MMTHVFCICLLSIFLHEETLRDVQKRTADLLAEVGNTGSSAGIGMRKVFEAKDPFNTEDCWLRNLGPFIHYLQTYVNSFMSLHTRSD